MNRQRIKQKSSHCVDNERLLAYFKFYEKTIVIYNNLC